MSLTHDISIIKQEYRDLFDLAHKRLHELFEEMKGQFKCTQCNTPPENVEDVLHMYCGYREWQANVIYALENTIGKQILDSLAKIDEVRNTKGACHMCGVCCELASSEFSYDELKAKAEGGDNFAQQFTSVFLPYESHEAARTKFPDTVTEILEQAIGDVHFYHCPYIDDESKKCTIYGDPKRPQICASYPETPLTLMYKNCGYQPWKDEMLPTTLLAHATLELCQHYANKILEAVKNPGEPLRENS